MTHNFSTMTDHRLLVDSNEAARLLGVSKRTLLGLRQTEHVPHIRLGHRVLFPVEGLREWVRQKQRT